MHPVNTVDTRSIPRWYRYGAGLEPVRRTTEAAERWIDLLSTAKEFIMNRYSLSSDSNRWWWPSGSAGAAAAAAVVAMVVVSLAPTSQAREREADRYGGGSVQPPDTVGVEAPCFIQPVKWNAALDGPLPRCTSDYVAAPAVSLARPRPAAADCPGLPDPRYVGGPWVAYTDECPLLREWWKHVELDQMWYTAPGAARDVSPE
jgi:hypothetical protein